MKLMRDSRYGATVAVKTDPSGDIEPIIQVINVEVLFIIYLSV